MNELVECHSGTCYAEKPLAFLWEGRRRVIKEITARWRIPGGVCFRVVDEEMQTFELFYGELYDEWRVNPV